MNDDKFIVCNVDCWDTFFKVSRIMEIKVNDPGWFFRGHSDSSWKLQSSYERYYDQKAKKIVFLHDRREKKRKNSQSQEMASAVKHYTRKLTHPAEHKRLQDEFFAISTFRKDACRYASHTMDLEWLAMMQHYGAPTRLLDVTSSIGTALYFAFENDLFDIEGNLKSKCIWAFRQKPLWKNQQEIQKEKIIVYEDEQDGNMIDPEDFYTEYLDDEYNRTVECLKLANKRIQKVSEYIAESEKKTGIIPVIPLTNNERVSAQEGQFLFPKNLSESFEENLIEALEIDEEYFNKPKTFSISDLVKDNFYNLRSKCDLIKFVFDPIKCHSVNDILRCANISAKNLFPDLTGIAKSIKY